MKRFINLFYFFLFVFTLHAKIEIDGIYYDIKGTNARVVSCDNFEIRYSGDVIIPSTIKHDGNTYNVTTIGDTAFERCSGLTSITIPESVTTIENYAFWGCTGLTSITIPESVTTIEGHAFDGCTGLTSVIIPNSVTEIGGSAFEGCQGLTSVIIGNSVSFIGWKAFSNCDNVKELIYAEGSKKANRTFLESIEKVTIPNSVTTIENCAFSECSGLTSITIPNSVTTIETGAFLNCTGLTSITIPESVTFLGDSVYMLNPNVFMGCSSLTSIVVEKGNRYFDSRENCNAIIHTSTNTLLTGCKNTVILNSVESIGEEAFAHCPDLTSITIPESVTVIGEMAFYDCSSLSSIVIPKSVETIKLCAFLDCKSLRAVYCYAENVPKTGSRTFNEPYMERVTLYVPESSLEDYKRKSPWKEFGTILPLSKEMEDIENIKLNANTWENFDLFGRKLNYSNTGIRIVNGKKVIR